MKVISRARGTERPTYRKIHLLNKCLEWHKSRSSIEGVAERKEPLMFSLYIETWGDERKFILVVIALNNPAGGIRLCQQSAYFYSLFKPLLITQKESLIQKFIHSHHWHESDVHLSFIDTFLSKSL